MPRLRFRCARKLPRHPSGTAEVLAIGSAELEVRVRTRHGEAGEFRTAAWMDGIGIQVEPETQPHAQLALEAFARFRSRPARLNLGDCFAHALAKQRGAALLYKGDDFSSTGIPRG